MLPLTAVLLQCLNENRDPIPNAFASGFIRKEEGTYFLYTSWHVVTGFDPHDLRVKNSPSRFYLNVFAQESKKRPGIESIGGEQSFTIPLYDTETDPAAPLWLQDDVHIPHPDLNTIGIHVPFWHDLAKIEIPGTVSLSDSQTINDESILSVDRSLLVPGDKCMIVGYPFGYSPDAPNKPSAVALTRFVAGNSIAGRPRQILIESPAAPGMSGGPVFLEREDSLFLFGVYSGLIYPDFAAGSNREVNALGVVDNITFALLDGPIPLVNRPTKKHGNNADVS